MHLGPIPVALIGSVLGLLCCSYGIFDSSRSDALDSAVLRSTAGMLLFFAGVLAYLQLGLGGLFGDSLYTSLSIEDKMTGRQVISRFGMWGCLAAAIEAVAVSIWLALRERRRPPR